ncbi:hypothetical protein ACFWPU_39335 [Streptomyces sp. NPDC058471]|uniref:hypothetical protein n=1 Tax=Streptomyces sp. NPDC058471 TaxID=3346516 RepID=UPI0036673487
MTGMDERPVSRAKLGQRGRLIVPAAVQKLARLHEGDQLVIRAVAEGSFVVETVEAVKARMRAAAPAGTWDSAVDAREDAADEAEND